MRLSGFLTGVIAGLLTGILIAPDKGQNTRDNLAETAEKWKNKINRLMGKSYRDIDDLRAFLEENIEGLTEDVRHRMTMILDEVEEMAYSADTSRRMSNV